MAEPNVVQSDHTKKIEVEREKPHQEKPQHQEKEKERRLKYLDFVHVAAIQALACISRLYDLAKENAGPLKPGVQTVEGTVKAVVGPVYDKFHCVPFEILKFVDRKVSDALEEVNRRVPSLVKEASTQAYTAAQKAPEVARSITDEVHRSGVINTASGLAKAALTKAEPAAKTIYTKCEPVAEHYAVTAWHTLNRLPVFPQVAQMVMPTAAHWTEKYNKAVCFMAGKGYGFAAYLPVVPTDKIAKAFGETGKKGKKGKKDK